jgi:hypothetical protein
MSDNFQSRAMNIESETGKRVEALKVLNLLARGIHPANGEMLDDGGCWNHPSVIRALLFATDYLSEMGPTSQGDEKSKSSQDRSGKAWSPQEDSELSIGFERQETLQHLSKRHKRSRGAIIARVSHLGLVKDRDEARKIFSTRLCNAEVELKNEQG